MENIISIIPDSPTILNNLIKAVHHYYPIGFTLRNDQYDGFQELSKIAETKINQTHSNNIPKARIEFEQQLKAVFKGCRVMNDFHIQYPSISYSIVLEKNDSTNFEKELLLTIKISLLTNYYTLFYQENLKHKDIVMSVGIPYYTTVVSLDSHIEKNKNDHVHQITQMMNSLFPQYLYVNHKLLFSIKVKYGVLYGEEDPYAKQENSLYAFLFDNQPHFSLLVVD